MEQPKHGCYVPRSTGRNARGLQSLAHSAHNDAGSLFDRLDHRRGIGIVALIAHGVFLELPDRPGNFGRHTKSFRFVEV
jgi:hypothetical protein